MKLDRQKRATWRSPSSATGGREREHGAMVTNERTLWRRLRRRLSANPGRFAAGSANYGSEPRFPWLAQGIALTHFIVSDDVERSRRFYTEVLGGETVRSGEPSYVALANSWIVINVGGGPTDDKPTVTLEAPRDRNRVNSFLNIRVADIHAVYAEWSGRGAEFLTPPIARQSEIRCYIRDPDGYLIEVGQTIRP
jgi:catechol 2,3-dioxygenase-like lactoylglutathione lyase family enzyme